MTDRELKAIYDKAQEYYRKAEQCMAEWRAGMQKQLETQLQIQMIKEAKNEARRGR